MTDNATVLQKLRALAADPTSIPPEALVILAEQAADIIDGLSSAGSEDPTENLRTEVAIAIEMEMARDHSGRAIAPSETELVRACHQLARTSRLANLRSVVTSKIPVSPEFMGMRAAATDIVVERLGQIEREGWTPAHDDQHTNGELAIAGALYASPLALIEMVDTAIGPMPRDPWPFFDFVREGQTEAGVPLFKQVPSFDNRAKHSRRRRLVIGAALILAEIERLDRAVEPSLVPASDSNPILAPARNS